MTKLIEKFAVQSLVEVDDELIFSKEKFAELIIQDVLCLVNNPVSYNKCVFTTFDAGIAGCIAQEIANSITEHFKDTK